MALELLAHVWGKSTVFRSLFASIAFAVNGLAVGAILAYQFNIFSILFAVLCLYRMFNMIRVVYARMHEHYLRNATRTTTFTLLGLQLVVAAGWIAWSHWPVANHTVWGAVGILQAGVAFYFLLTALRTAQRTAWPTKQTSYSDDELPTVTVAIAARNEIEGLQQCLQSVVASDYPKLEILALDDRSLTRRTPEIIRSFAHDGVRFVHGDEPAPTWLPKNQAYNRLVEEASGEYLLFCGADVLFESHTIREMITTMLDRKKQMLSVLPQRTHDTYGYFSLIQGMRHWWELVPPRRRFQRPPIFNSCWVITTAALQKAGGFPAVARAIVPEAHFAQQLTATDEYSFLRANAALGIQGTKTVAEQRATAVRMRYPQLHRRPEQVALVSLVEAFFLVLPYAMSIAGFWLSIGWVAHVSIVLACFFATCAYELTVVSARVNTWWFGLIAQPLAALVDILLLHYSMYKYEFSTVEWKGRNVAVPVMHVIPHLPKLQ